MGVTKTITIRDMSESKEVKKLRRESLNKKKLIEYLLKLKKIKDTDIDKESK